MHCLACRSHFTDMALHCGPVVEAQLPRNQVLGLGEPWGRLEACECFRLASARRLEQILGAFALLFKIETELRIGPERVGHDRFPYRLPAFAQADKGSRRPGIGRYSVVGAALSANVDAPTERRHA